MTKNTMNLDAFWYAINLVLKDSGKPELGFFDARYYWDRAKHEFEVQARDRSPTRYKDVVR